jgi:enterochelin esterase-like enzyme
MAALRLGDVLALRRTGAELDGSVAVTTFFADGDDLQAFERQNGDRHVAAVVLEQAGHPQLLRDHASAHDQMLLYRGTLGTIPSGACLSPKYDASPRLG